MPGIDFKRLRAEITMEEVLNLLGFEPSRPHGRLSATDLVPSIHRGPVVVRSR